MASQILNQAFNPHDIGFDLVSITRTTNNAWAIGVNPNSQTASSPEVAFKNALRQVMEVFGATVVKVTVAPAVKVAETEAVADH